MGHCLCLSLLAHGYERQETLVVKITAFRLEGSGFKYCLSHLLAVCPWASYLTTQSLHFSIHKMGRMVVHTYIVVVEIKLSKVGKVFSTMMASGEATQGQLCDLEHIYNSASLTCSPPLRSEARQHRQSLGFKNIPWNSRRVPAILNSVSDEERCLSIHRPLPLLCLM